MLARIFTELSPQMARKQAMAVRNQHIQVRFALGELVIDLAKAYGLSEQRISQIIHGQ